MLRDLLSDLRFRLRAVFRHSDVERELAEEIQLHIDVETDRLVREGLPVDDARRRARLSLGGVEHVKEAMRDVRGVRWLDDLAQDLHYAFRSLRRTSTFTAITVLTLALGIGATTAVFTVVNGVLLRPLPLHDPGHLVLLHFGPPNFGFGGPSLPDSYFRAIRDHARSFEGVSMFSPNSQDVTMTGVGEPVVIRTEAVTHEFFDVLGVRPALGSNFVPDDDKPGAAPVIILSDALWHERFNSDPGIVGKTIALEGGNAFFVGASSYTIIGVAPPGFDFPEARQAWVPVGGAANASGFVFVEPVVARLKRGVTTEAARAELESIVRALPEKPRLGADTNVVRVLPLAQLLVRDAQRSLWIFAGAAGFVLLIACANVANLMLMRAAARTQEIAVRATLGANRWRLARQVLTESVLLSLLGAALGIPLAAIGVRTLLALSPAGSIPRVSAIHVDAMVLAFTIVVSLITGIVFGLAPAIQTSRWLPATSLGHGSHLTAGRHRLRSALAISEIALALVLLTGAGLMVKSFLRLRGLDLGFNPEHVVAMNVRLRSTRYGTAERMEQFHSQTLTALSRIPDAAVIGVVSFRPLAGGTNLSIEIEGQSPLEGGAWTPAASADYFRAIGIPILSGRTFTAHEEEVASGVAIVSRSVADRSWPGQSAIGKRVALRFRADSTSEPDWLTVVGVVGDVRQELTQPLAPAIYQPISQALSLSNPFLVRRGMQDFNALNNMWYVVRTRGQEGAIERGIHDAVRDVDPNVPLRSLAPLPELVAANRSEPLFQARLLVAFSIMALALAVVGIYGVLACSVVERTREIGIRMALGAESVQVVAIVVRRAAVLTVLGVAIGAAGAFAATRVLSKFLYAVSPTDPLTFLTTALSLAVVALFAGALPARRASRVDPLVSLRHE